MIWYILSFFIGFVLGVAGVGTLIILWIESMLPEGMGIRDLIGMKDELKEAMDMGSWMLETGGDNSEG